MSTAPLPGPTPATAKKRTGEPRRPGRRPCQPTATAARCRPMRNMVIRVPQQTGYGGVLHVAVSVPRIERLIDGVKYVEPQDVKAMEGSDLGRERAPRTPPLRVLVRYALACDEAERLGEQMRRGW
jgi:hypothetical protein